MKTLIIPDVHGRIFWKTPAEEFLKNNSERKIVFLGDYLDPYKGEGISQERAINNFSDIIEFKKIGLTIVLAIQILSLMTTMS